MSAVPRIEEIKFSHEFTAGEFEESSAGYMAAHKERQRQELAKFLQNARSERTQHNGYSTHRLSLYVLTEDQLHAYLAARVEHALRFGHMVQAG